MYNTGTCNVSKAKEDCVEDERKVPAIGLALSDWRNIRALVELFIVNPGARTENTPIVVSHDVTGTQP